MGHFYRSERIKVVYRNGIQDNIGPSLLPTLIDAKEVSQFKRSDGWVIIGVDPIRGKGGPPYQGSNRRTNRG